MARTTKKPAESSDAPAKVVVVDLKPFIQPVSTLLAACIIAAAILINGSALGSVTPTTTGTTTTTTSQNTGTTASVTQDQIKGLFTSSNIYFGNPDSKVLFVEFSDPSCPYCHIAAGKDPELNAQAGTQFQLVSQGGTYVAPVIEMKKLVDEGKAAYAWVYTTGHGAGELGAQAFYCANEKGKFWEAHDILMSQTGYDKLNNTIKNDKANSGALADLLKPAVDPTFMKSCLESGKYASKISEGNSLAAQFGVSGTPGFFVNNVNFAGAYSYTDMQTTVSQFL